MSIASSVSWDEGPATCDWSSSWAMSSEMWARIWFLWAIAGRRMMTWAFVIRRPEPIQNVDKKMNEEMENTPSEGPFKLAFANLSYPRRKRKPAKGKRAQQDMATKDLTFGFWWLLPPLKGVGLLSESLWESSSYATRSSNVLIKILQRFRSELTTHIGFCQREPGGGSLSSRSIRLELRWDHALLLRLPTPTMPFHLDFGSIFQSGANC